MKDYVALDELIPKTQELHRAIFDKGYEQGFKDGVNSEYEHDHKIVKAYNDGQAYILDKIRAEIELHRRKTESIDPYDLVGDCLAIIDKHKAGEDT